MKRMLITGGTGFLGGRVAEYFKNTYELSVPTRQEMDITDAAAVERTFQAFRPDVVIHCAAMSDTSRCQREPELSWAWNVDGSIHVAKVAKQVGAKCILCSSDQVYFAVPSNIYAKEKLAAEEAGRKINPDAVFLRLSWMYDPNLTSTAQRSDFFTNLLPKLDTAEEVSYAVFDRRGITNVYEVVANLEKAIKLPGGCYDFGAPNDKSMYETAVAIFEGLDLDSARVKENRTAFQDNPRDMTMNQEVINSYGISFADTADALIRNFAKHRKS